jgi:enoyl-[acyl-carrier protein] reductase / trans-2-enoyl-CoA reductase (NAD+)
MPAQVIKRRSRGFICINAHPAGCFRNVQRQVSVMTKPGVSPGRRLRNVLVIGASTGYGLASRIAAAWGFGAHTLGVFFERPPEGVKTATAGYYNTCALHELARRDGLRAASLNADAFSHAAKRETIQIAKRDFAPLDLVIYSLASPRRVDANSGEVFNSVLKPVGRPFESKTIELDSEKVVPVTIEPASEKDIADTVAVMGGEDWAMWMKALLEAQLLARGARTLAYSYIGPELTWPIYKEGTIGRAKQDLEQTARQLHTKLAAELGGGAWVSVNKAVVTQASAAIPVVPLYLSLLQPALGSRQLDEGPIDQMQRLFKYLADGDHFAPDLLPTTDEAGRIRLDDREMRADVQQEIRRLWPQVSTENLREITGFAGFQREFRQLFGFEVEGIDYDAPVETNILW